LFASLLAIAVGCAHDLPGWKVAANANFRLYTDRPRRSFDPLIERLQEVHTGLASSFFGGVTVPPMEIFLFETGEFSDLLGDKIGGLFLGGQRGQSGTLVLPEAWDPAYLDKTAAHELAHAFINATFQNVPIWFNEGFASYCESIKVIEDKVWFGSSHVFAAESARRGELVPVSDLFSARAERFHDDLGTRHYTTAWAVIHYIWHGENKSLRGRFDQFGATLATSGKGPSGSSMAWQATYGDIPFTEVDGRLRDHLTAVFALPKSSMVGFRMNSKNTGEVALAPADLRYVDGLRAALKKVRLGKD
jgi:hypothetical protein